MARPQKIRCICSKPKVTGLIPEGCPGSGNINLTYDEYEVIRLLDYIKLTAGAMCRKNEHFPSNCNTHLQRSETENSRCAGKWTTNDNQRR